jgi:hypothetical protein
MSPPRIRHPRTPPRDAEEPAGAAAGAPAEVAGPAGAGDTPAAAAPVRTPMTTAEQQALRRKLTEKFH